MGTIRGQESTRRIGDYKVKYGYTDIELLRSEKLNFVVSSPPFLHDPSILTYYVTIKYQITLSLSSAAKSKPIIAEPEIHGGHSLDGVTGFLVLMSEGLYKALEAAHGPGQANQVSLLTWETFPWLLTHSDGVSCCHTDLSSHLSCECWPG